MSKQRVLPPHGKTNYPWKRWMDGKVHKAVQVKHFPGAIETFRRFLFVKAKNAGMRVTTRVQGNSVLFQFSPKEPA